MQVASLVSRRRPRRANHAELKRYAQLTDALSRMSCRDLVEVGTWNGRRAVELVTAALRANEAVTYHGFDLFEALTDDDLEDELSKRPPSREEVEARLRRLQRRTWLTSALQPWRRRRFDFALHQGYTRDTLPAFRHAHPAFRAQFVFIDGGHSVETIRNDWEHCCRFVDEGGAIFLDDYYGDAALARRFGCNTLVDDLRGDPTWEVTVLPEQDEIAGLGTIRIVCARPTPLGGATAR